MFILAVLVACAGCRNARTQRAPTVEAPSMAPVAKEPKRDFLQEAGDATWRVVTVPARIITPPKKAEPREPVTYEAPVITFTRRTYADEEPKMVSTTSPATQAGTGP